MHKKRYSSASHRYRPKELHFEHRSSSDDREPATLDGPPNNDLLLGRSSPVRLPLVEVGLGAWFDSARVGNAAGTLREMGSRSELAERWDIGGFFGPERLAHYSLLCLSTSFRLGPSDSPIVEQRVQPPLSS